MKKPASFLMIFFLLMSFSCNLSGKNTSIPTKEPVRKLEPTLTKGPNGSIKGILWHDICEFTGGEGGQPVVLGQGCVQWGSGADEFGPDQKQDDFEVGWSEVTIHLGKGNCPSTGLATAVTDKSGGFQFEGLESGAYCISYSNLADKNDVILIPGAPTFPARGEEGFSTTVNLSPDEEETIKFGYAWQFFN